jgi:hypothetical protein
MIMNVLRMRGVMFQRLAVAALLATLASAVAAQVDPVSKPLLTSRVDPKEFGVQDQTRTVITALAFSPSCANCRGISGSLGVYCTITDGMHYYAALDLPAGAVIDSIGLNDNTDTDAIFSLKLWQRNRLGQLTLLEGFSSTGHPNWDTDFSGPLSIPIPDHIDGLMFDVGQGPSPTFQFFGWVEVWWHRTVSPAPGAASFGDVPTNHPFFQFIEALRASGITGGCGNGNYCPDTPLTRGQMAVFLAKALGLHWPN